MGLTFSLEGGKMCGHFNLCGQISLLLTMKSFKLGKTLLDKVVELSLLGTCESRLNNAQENVL